MNRRPQALTLPGVDPPALRRLPPSDVLLEADLCAYWRCSRGTVYRLLQEQLLDAFYVRGSLRFHRREILAFQRRRQFTTHPLDPKTVERLCGPIATYPLPRYAILRIEELMGHWQVSARTLVREMRDGELRAFRLMDELRFTRSEVFRYESHHTYAQTHFLDEEF